jgi:hypothetical protein
MEYWNNAQLNSVWETLKFRAGRAGISGINTMGVIRERFLKKQDGNLVYVNNRGYQNVLIHAVKQTAMQITESQANRLLPKYKQYIEKQYRDDVLEQQDKNLKKLIEAGEAVDKGLGFIDIPGHRIVAKNKYGDCFPEAFMMYYESNREIDVTDVVYQNGKPEKTSYKTNVVCFIDLIASVTVQSAKNLVLTQVQGRDYTRKELVSGGDLTFSVNGKMVNEERGGYPENDVKKFIQIAQYGGVVKVNHFLFRQFNVDQIIIKEYSLGESKFKNEQPYSFSCVAVEPDEDVIISKDTIGVLNQEIVASQMNRRYELILNDKLVSIASNTVSSGVTSVVAGGLDLLIPNI